MWPHMDPPAPKLRREVGPDGSRFTPQASDSSRFHSTELVGARLCNSPDRPNSLLQKTAYTAGTTVRVTAQWKTIVEARQQPYGVRLERHLREGIAGKDQECRGADQLVIATSDRRGTITSVMRPQTCAVKSRRLKSVNCKTPKVAGLRLLPRPRGITF